MSNNLGNPLPTSFNGEKVIVYLFAWRGHELIPWPGQLNKSSEPPDIQDTSPSNVFLTSSRSIWRYFQGLCNEYSKPESWIGRISPFRSVTTLALNDLGGLLPGEAKEIFSRNLKQVIGHTAFIMVHLGEGKDYCQLNAEDILAVSHTGGDPGKKFLRRPLNGVIVWLNARDVLTKHVKDGSLDSLSKIYWRTLNQEAPRVKRVELCGSDSVQYIKKVQDAIKCSKLEYYGLNTAVDWLRDSPIKGGCGNAVATALSCANLGHIIPDGGEFQFKISPRQLADYLVPILISKNAFDKEGMPRDKNLFAGLPKSWDNSDPEQQEVHFWDPSYWYVNMEPDSYEKYQDELSLVFRGIKPERSASH